MELLTDEQRALFDAGGCLADYDVLKPIGKGKFSVVYKAQRRRDAVPVALKKIAIFDLMDARAREKTLKEVRLVQSVSHEHIVQYMDAFLDGKELHIAFEWADAGDLKRQIRKASEKGVRLDERTIWRYFSQICSAIRHLHEARIMHRDLKPANIFLTTQGMVKVGDLGLGRHLSENTLEAHSKVGTPLYMSPEVLKGEGYDWKSDVWSLGCILYELAMLRSPFKSEGLNLYGLFQKINKGDYEPLPEVYSDHLRVLVTQMISLDAARRPTMEQVWRACQTRPTPSNREERPPSTRPPQQVQQPTQRDNGGLNPPAKSVASPTPAPSPSSSRPSSQQSDSAPRSANSSRPSSSEKAGTARPQAAARPPSPALAVVSDEEIAQRQEDAVMEFLYERLKLLAGDGDSGGKAVPTRFTRHHFASESRTVPSWTTSPHERFKEMCRVARWLLRLCGNDSLDGDDGEDQSPILQAQMLLLATERVGACDSGIAQLSAASLTSGCGLGVCLLLNALSIKALEATSAKRGRPVYPRDAIENVGADDQQWELQSDDHEATASGESTTSTPIRGVGTNSGDGGNDGDDGDDGGWMDARWLVVREPERRGTKEDQENAAMIHACVDASAWAREVEKMQGKLHDQWRACHVQSSSITSGWLTRLEMLQRQCQTVDLTKRPTCESLARTSVQCEKETSAIALIESRLQAQHDRPQQLYREASVRVQRSLETAQVLQDALSDRTRTYTTIETAAQARIHELQQANARVTDTTPLIDIKTQLRRIQDENEAMRVQIEVARSQLWKYTT